MFDVNKAIYVCSLSFSTSRKRSLRLWLRLYIFRLFNASVCFIISMFKASRSLNFNPVIFEYTSL
mgnify:CR=1 FL=1